MVSASDVVRPSVLARLLGSAPGIRAVVVGDLMLDEYVGGEVERVSAEAPVPVVRVADERHSVGGAGHVAHVLAQLGAGASVVGVVGTDDAAQLVLDDCRSAGVQVDGVVVVDGRPTSRKTRVVSGPQQIVRLDREVTTEVTAEVEGDLIDGVCGGRPADVVVVSDYCKGVVTDAVIADVLALGRQLGVPVLVDTKHQDLRRFAGATVVKLNRDEFERACSLELGQDPVAALRLVGPAVREQIGVDVLVVTLGSGGMVVLDAQPEPAVLPTVASDVFDVAGAGDVVAGIMALAMACGIPPRDAAAVACVGAGISVRRRGVVAVSPAELVEEVAPDAPSGSVMTRAALVERVTTWRQAGRRIVFTNGCFDMFHAGHLELLRRAAAHGDRLVVAVDSDWSVRRLKGPGRPLITATARMAILAALDDVDAVVMFDDDLAGLIRDVRPDVLVKGADYADRQVVGRDEVESYGGRVELVPLLVGHSTTSIVQRLGRLSGDPTAGVV